MIDHMDHSTVKTAGAVDISDQRGRNVSALEEYQKVGGLAGLARKQLLDALSEAQDNSNHEFHPVVGPLSRFSMIKATNRLLNILRKAHSEASSKYRLSALLYLQVPAAKVTLEHAWKYLEERGWKGPADNEDLEDVWNHYLDLRKKEKASKIFGGASNGGKVTANKWREENKERDLKIRKSPLSAGELAEIHGRTPRRVRQIVNFE